MAPAARRRETRVASWIDTGAARRPSVPAVQTVPASSIESFTLKRDAVHGAGGVAARQYGIGGTSVRQGARGKHLHHGVERGVDLRDPVQMELDQLHGGELAGCESTPPVCGGESQYRLHAPILHGGRGSPHEWVGPEGTPLKGYVTLRVG